jgi:hypothetical protein
MAVPEPMPALRTGRDWPVATTVVVALVVVGVMFAAGVDQLPRARPHDPVILAPPTAESPPATPVPSTSGTPGRSASVTPRRSGPSPSPSAAASASPLPASVGMVDVRAVAANPGVLAVGGLLDRYFSGINTRQYGQVLALFDPSGFLDPNNPAQVKSFTQGVSTSTDSQVVLRSITDDAATKGDLDVRLTLQSHQSAGFGPPGSPDETCTNWDITYQLRPAGGGYRILTSQAVVHAPC